MSRDQVVKELLERRVRRDVERHKAEGAWVRDELSDAWHAAQAEAFAAYEQWRHERGADAYAVYRAAQDRADEAQDALWQQHILATAGSSSEAWLA